jgi:nucleotide-binding universal stress UspA family protein
MYDRILVPVDGSAPAKRAVGYGALLAEAYGAELELLHVLARGGGEGAGDDGRADSDAERGAAVLGSAREVVGDRVPVETRLLEGVPHRVVSDHVAGSEVDLVVMGRRGRAGLGEGLLGSVTERVLVGTDAPVLVVPEGDPETVPDGLSTVLLPTDGSENAEAATGHAVDLVRRFGAAIHVATVVDAESAGGLFGAEDVTDDLVERLEAGGEEAVARMVEAVRAVDPDLDPATAVVHGTPHEGIRDYVLDHGVDLVAMGSRGRSDIERQLFGSVTKRVLRVVDVPVLVVRDAE